MNGLSLYRADPLVKQNGSVTGDSPLAPLLRQEGTTDERLAAIAETIAAWDWRSGAKHRQSSVSATSPPPTSIIGTSVAESPKIPGETFTRTEIATPAEPITPASAAAPTELAATPETDALPHALASTESAAATETIAPTHKRRKLWPFLVAAAVVAGAAAGYVKGTTHSGTKAPQHNATTPSHSPSVLVQFETAENTVNVAGVGLTSALQNLNTLPTVANLTPPISAYVSALQKYSSALAAIPWTKDLAKTSGGVKVQVGAFITFLQTLPGVQPIALGSWVAQLHTHGAAVTTAMKRLRFQLGLPG
jgi:hypothetical protein